MSYSSAVDVESGLKFLQAPLDTPETDTPEVNLPFPIYDYNDPTQKGRKGVDFEPPNNIKTEVVYDPETGRYVFVEKIGDSIYYRNPSSMTLEEYLDYDMEQSLKDYWRDRVEDQTEEDRGLIPPVKVESEAFENIFGSDEINIRPQGSAELRFGVNVSRYDNPILPERQRRVAIFDFNQQMQINLVGQIGDRMKITTGYNTQATFDFENEVKLEYTGDEDMIIQKIEAGNVSMPLNSTLIRGSSNLFGLKTHLRFGKLDVYTIMSQQRGRRQEINVEGGAQVQDFEISASNYEANRHYFLNFYHRDNYDRAMSSLPVVSSNVNITRIEVWVTNVRNNTEETRNFVAFADLGESNPDNTEGTPGGFSNNPLPDNDHNNLYQYLSNNPDVRGFNNAVQALNNEAGQPGPFQQSVHYEKVENARKLQDQEFTYNAMLGYISLNQPLNNDEVLAVAYEYTHLGQTYQVGELSTDGITGKDALILKLLKPTVVIPSQKVWDLMMKNVYSIGAYQVSKENFYFDIWYNNPQTSAEINYMPYEGVDDELLIQLIDMDRINLNEQPFQDGAFDFAPVRFNGNRGISGGTINPQNGRVYLSTIEPFGTTIRKKMEAAGTAPLVVNRVVYQELYDSTKTAAELVPSKNRFTLKGTYQSSVSSEISLNAFNIPEGSVKVIAGGIQLQENVDYTVDYNLGRVKIINDGILEAQTPLSIQVENNSTFGFQSKSLLGTRFDYRFNEDFNIGATLMRMNERPLTQKVNFGDEPVSNTMVGFDVNYRSEVPFLTKMVDAIPLISTKEKSTITASAEYAHLLPGSPRVIGEGGISYIDDFEGTQSLIDLRNFSAWRLASVPQGQPDMFPEGELKNDLSAGFNRAKLAWYVIDPLFYQNNNVTPQHIRDNPEIVNEDSRVRQLLITEIFPNFNPAQGQLTNIPALDLAYYPNLRGQYNFDVGSSYSAGMDNQGYLREPETRWAGIMRALNTTNFELSNIEFVQFWVLDPFNEDADPEGNKTGGDLYINLGNISEDVLPDSRKSFENGLPTGTNLDPNRLDTTVWGRVSTDQAVVNAFDNNPEARVFQDIGLDGLNSEEERTFYQDFVNWVTTNLPQNIADSILQDPASDDYTYYRDDEYDSQELGVLERYMRFNGMEGNSPTSEQAAQQNADGYPTQATNRPDMEDVNMDNNLSESESYFQYRISMRKGDLVEGQNYITNVTEVPVPNTNKVERWYQFKVPVRDFEKSVNGIADFRSIRFMRMFMKNFEDTTILRFAKLELIRGEWRTYREDLLSNGEFIQPEPGSTVFNIGAVNVEENDQRDPVNYAIPPGIERQQDIGTANLRLMNEQSLQLEVCNLLDGDARAAVKNATFDVRNYKKLQMFVHGEYVDELNPTEDDEVTVFIRLGTDYNDNYYEYEMPLKMTPWGASTPEQIWPEENNIEITLKNLTRVKQSRNGAMENNPSITMATPFSERDPDDTTRLITVKGSPNLQGIKTMMIGVRNPSANENNPWKPDDGEPKCAIVWVNELRLSDFDESGGWATTGRVQLQLADFANIAVAGNYSTPFWGSIESKPFERQRDTRASFDMNSTFQMGKFFGNKLDIQMPMTLVYSWNAITPQFDPLNQDVLLSDVDPSVRNERLEIARDLTRRKAINFTNVRKQRPSGKDARFWNIENFALTFGYNELYRSDFNTEYDRTEIWKGGVNYTHNGNPILFEPFKEVKAFQKNKWVQWIKDMNLYLGPKVVSVQGGFNRRYNERKMRNVFDTIFEFQPVYLKNFTINRVYDMKYDITKNIKFDINAVNNSIFTEPTGKINRVEDPENYDIFMDSIRQDINTLGRTMNYAHNMNLNVNLPLSKIPITDWVNVNGRYSTAYEWNRAPLGQDSLGNVIQNSRTFSVNGRLNFTKLYDKSDFLSRVNNGPKGAGRGRRSIRNVRKNLQGGKGGNDDVELEGIRGWFIKRLKKRVKKVGDKLESSTPPENVSQDSLQQGEYLPPEELETLQTKKDTLDEKLERKLEAYKEWKEKKEERSKKEVNIVVRTIARTFMSVRNASITYTQNDGTMLPGYNQETRIMGMNQDFSAPTTGFIFGEQQRNLWGQDVRDPFAVTAGNNDWIVKNPNINQQHLLNNSQNISARVTLEPIKDLRIDLTVDRNINSNLAEFFRYNDSIGDYQRQNTMQTGTITYSTLTWRTAFEQLQEDFRSVTFDQLRDNRADVSEILGQQNGLSAPSDTSAYYTGYGGTQQEVLIGAFLTTYTGSNPNSKNISVFGSIPLPNWNITYDGLGKYEFMKKIVQNFTISHGYRSSVSLSNYTTNLNAQPDPNTGLPTTFDAGNNFLSRVQATNIVISEQLNPLIGFDATWNIQGNGLITKFEIRRDRNIALSLANNQITEIRGNEFVIGAGYKWPKLKMPFKVMGKNPVSPLNIRADLVIRDNRTVIRKIVENTSQGTAGQRVFSLKTSADYSLTKNFNVRLYFDRVINTPIVDLSYPTANTNAGIALRFNLN